MPLLSTSDTDLMVTRPTRDVAACRYPDAAGPMVDDLSALAAGGLV